MSQNIIYRNFFRLLRAGALGEYSALEPMSPYKWRRLAELADTTATAATVGKGIRCHQYDVEVPVSLPETAGRPAPATARLSSRWLERRYERLREREPHAMDASMETLRMLDLIVAATAEMTGRGLLLPALLDIATYLRSQGDRVDFMKTERWLRRLHLERMASLQGSMLIALLGFELDEIPYMHREEAGAEATALALLGRQREDGSATDWHIRQGRAGLVYGNTENIFRWTRRTLHYLPYAPMETTACVWRKFVNSLEELEE